MTEQSNEMRDEAIYLASVDLLRKLLRDKQYDRKILERLNKLNAKSMNCRLVPLD